MEDTRRYAARRADRGRARGPFRYRNELLGALIGFLLLAGNASGQSNLDGVNHHAWSEGAGWFVLKPAHGGVVVHREFFAGFAWFENVGWVKLGVDTGGPYGNSGSSDWGVNVGTDGALSGFAWSESCGWIDFSPTGGGVAIDLETGAFDGFGWSENLGWIHFANLNPDYGVNVVVPSLPAIVSSDPLPATWSSRDTIEVGWSGATGNDLGLGYSYVLDHQSSTEPDTIIDLPHQTDPQVFVSSTLSDRTDYYLHLRSCDPVGICSSALHHGQFWIDTGPPEVSAVRSVAATADGELHDHEQTVASITKLYAAFDEPVLDPGGDSESNDVTNPDNYLLVRAGDDGAFETVDCLTGIHPSDLSVSCDRVIYEPSTSTAILEINGKDSLERDLYRLLICGTTSIVDEAENPLDGNADGVGGDDHRLDFRVIVSNLLHNPNLDESLDGWDRASPLVNEITHSSIDVEGVPTSGSARVYNLSGPNQSYELSQCVDLPRSGGFLVGGMVAIGSASPADPTARVVVRLFRDAGCRGDLLQADDVAQVSGDTGGAWKRLSGTFVASPVSAASARVAFVIDAGACSGITVFLDRLLFLDDLLFADDLETGDTSQWSSAVQ